MFSTCVRETCVDVDSFLAALHEIVRTSTLGSMRSAHVSERRVLIFTLVSSMRLGIARTSTPDSMGCPHFWERRVLILTVLSLQRAIVLTMPQDCMGSTHVSERHALKMALDYDRRDASSARKDTGHCLNERTCSWCPRSCEG